MADEKLGVALTPPQPSQPIQEPISPEVSLPVTVEIQKQREGFLAILKDALKVFQDSEGKVTFKSAFGTVSALTVIAMIFPFVCAGAIYDKIFGEKSSSK